MTILIDTLNHYSSVEDLPEEQRPDFHVKSLSEIEHILRDVLVPLPPARPPTPLSSAEG